MSLSFASKSANELAAEASPAVIAPPIPAIAAPTVWSAVPISFNSFLCSWAAFSAAFCCAASSFVFFAASLALSLVSFTALSRSAKGFAASFVAFILISISGLFAIAAHLLIPPSQIQITPTRS